MVGSKIPTAEVWLLVAILITMGCSYQNVVEPRVVSEKDVIDVPICELDTSAVEDSIIPRCFGLSICWEDEDKDQLNITFSLPTSAKVELTIYAQSGEEIRKLVHEVMTAGFHMLMWDLRDSRGVKVSPGVYGVVVGTWCFKTARWFEIE